MSNRHPKGYTATLTAEQFVEETNAAIEQLRAAILAFEETADRLLAARPEPENFHLRGVNDEPEGLPHTPETWCRYLLLSYGDERIDAFRWIPDLESEDAPAPWRKSA